DGLEAPPAVQVYQKPPISLLRLPDRSESIANDSPSEKARLLIETLASFNISAKVMNISVGPVITRFEIQPAQGIRVNRITSLSNDIALALAAPRVRIEAPIPGKAAIGIEIPNKDTAMVRLREVLDTREFATASSPLTFALGKDIAGKPVYANLEKMPHMLIAGATGSGKSVCINSIILSTLYKSSPDEVRMILIDPKVVELSIFAPVPHLYCPVVTDPKKAAGVLKWACNEMDQRYSKMSKVNARDLARFNSLQTEPENRMPRLMIIIDELADLMIVSAKDVEESIARLAQLGRACGIHLIVATQRPSVDVITGLIKTNIPSRIAFAVSSAIDSRVILDGSGAEKLLGHGDMLFHPNGAAKPTRAQGAYVSDEEVENIMQFFVDHQIEVPQNNNVLDAIPDLTAPTGQGNGKQEDELLPDAVRIVMDSGSASISMIQRRLRVGYARAARLVDIMEQMKLVSGFDGSKPRKVLIDEAGYRELFGDNSII
ncbi:MAG: DNA translocase FtsK, partial [Clostridia bacterium]|nr:DNA translocase FtsK [Clostridia bacterium]